MKPDKLLCCLFSFAFRPCTNNDRIWNVFEQLTNRNVFLKIFNCGVNVKTKDCAESRPFQHKLQHNCFHGKVSKPVPQLTNAQNKETLPSFGEVFSSMGRRGIVLFSGLIFCVLLFQNRNDQNRPKRMRPQCPYQDSGYNCCTGAEEGDEPPHVTP